MIDMTESRYICLTQFLHNLITELDSCEHIHQKQAMKNTIFPVFSMCRHFSHMLNIYLCTLHARASKRCDGYCLYKNLMKPTKNRDGNILQK